MDEIQVKYVDCAYELRRGVSVLRFAPSQRVFGLVHPNEWSVRLARLASGQLLHAQASPANVPDVQSADEIWLELEGGGGLFRVAMDAAVEIYQCEGTPTLTRTAKQGETPTPTLVDAAVIDGVVTTQAVDSAVLDVLLHVIVAERDAAARGEDYWK